jgi:hypothetical protein
MSTVVYAAASAKGAVVRELCFHKAKSSGCQLLLAAQVQS